MLTPVMEELGDAGAASFDRGARRHAAGRVSAIGRLVLIAVPVAGCELFNGDRILGETIVLRNGTTGLIEIVTIHDGVESRLARIEPRQEYAISAAQFTDGCLSGPFIARANDGTVLATNQGEPCSGDSWKVET